MIEVICDNCGAKLDRTPRDTNQYEHHFCNRNCYMEYLAKKRIKKNIEIGRERILRVRERMKNGRKD